MPTPYADLNAVIAELVSGALEILGENFCGAYLQGSFAVGDADEHSDVDFLVVVHDELTDAQQAALKALHERLYAIDTPWAQHLEGSYVPERQLRRMSPERPPWFYFDNGATEPIWDNHDNSAVVRWSLREHGVVLAGPDPKTLVDPISAAEIQADVLVALAEWEEWLPTLDSWSARLQPLVVLSYCRILNTLESCVVMSSVRQASGRSALWTSGGAGSSSRHSTTGTIRGPRFAGPPTRRLSRVRARSSNMPAVWLDVTKELGQQLVEAVPALDVGEVAGAFDHLEAAVRCRGDDPPGLVDRKKRVRFSDHDPEGAFECGGDLRGVSPVAERLGGPDQLLDCALRRWRRRRARRPGLDPAFPKCLDRLVPGCPTLGIVRPDTRAGQKQPAGALRCETSERESDVAAHRSADRGELPVDLFEDLLGPLVDRVAAELVEIRVDDVMTRQSVALRRPHLGAERKSVEQYDLHAFSTITAPGISRACSKP
jgi:hypothetical protein